jgi:hypothetical protein
MEVQYYSGWIDEYIICYLLEYLYKFVDGEWIYGYFY